MLRRFAIAGTVLLGLFAALVAVACDGDDEDDSTAGPQETPTPTESVVAASPADLASYRYTVEVSMQPSVLDFSEAPEGLTLEDEIHVEIEGERVNPDREHTVTSADLGFLQVETETIAIGAQRWLRESNGAWRDGGAPALETFAGLDFRPSTLFLDDAGQYDEVARRLNGYEWEEEERDGITTRHFTLDEEAFYELFQGEQDVLPAEVNATLSAEIWLERDLGTPVALLVTGVDDAGDEVMRLELELSDLNDEDITIESPA